MATDLLYNATVDYVRKVHDDLMIMRIRTDHPAPHYHPGQYLTLGLTDNERRYDQDQVTTPVEIHMIRRAYSISCPLIKATGELLPNSDSMHLEFYITLVNLADEYEPRYHPRLTPRLFALEPGSRLQVSLKAVGKYVLTNVTPQTNIIFAATGTGEAPHNSMTAELLAQGHPGRILSICCVRYKKDAGYLDEHLQLMARYPNYRYELLTTREPENIDPTHPNYQGKVYLQNLFAGDQFEQKFGWQMSPEHTQIYLCGNPDMIGLPKRNEAGELEYPRAHGQMGMIEILVNQNYEVSAGQHAGQVHFEKYW
jgi:ferredoxin--NADP+ reductase